jgi:hypothetical protein
MVEQTVTSDDVLLAWRMAYGVVVTTADRAQVRPAVTRALSLLPLP